MCRCHAFEETREPASTNKAGKEPRGRNQLRGTIRQVEWKDFSVCPQLPILSHVSLGEKVSQMAPQE